MGSPDVSSATLGLVRAAIQIPHFGNARRYGSLSAAIGQCSAGRLADQRLEPVPASGAHLQVPFMRLSGGHTLKPHHLADLEDPTKFPPPCCGPYPTRTILSHIDLVISLS